jgi:alpha-L-glutamate ligase-like protein
VILGLAKKLATTGVLGINRRNAEYTLRYNERRHYPLVDDKLQTKQLAQKAGIAVPELYGVVEAPYQIRQLLQLLEPYSDFVIKPARGSGGVGVLIITERLKNRMYRKVNGAIVSPDELKHHVLNVLSGIYSLGGQPDKVIVEYCVRFDPVFDTVSYQGVPDIRIIVFLGVPVMGMIRLPTRMSDGKANLHQGAVGAGIDLATGTTLTAVYLGDIIEEHPDTGNSVAGIKIPGWERLLELAAQCYELTGLGYQGVDIVLDRDKGPLILELNARPGLNIQIANRTGLMPRLRQVEEHRERLANIKERVAFAREQFGISRY